MSTDNNDNDNVTRIITVQPHADFHEISQKPKQLHRLKNTSKKHNRRIKEKILTYYLR